jgi:hypothetical protein
MNHYVYYSYETWGRGYIGVRSCRCKPEEDRFYFGSYKDKKFKPTEKIILFVFETRKEALDAEISLHDFFKVHVNKRFANRSKQLSNKFSTAGCEGPWKNRKQSSEHVRRHAEALRGRKLSEETKRKIGLKSKGNKHRAGHLLTEEQKEHLRKLNTGRRHSEETKKKISEKLKLVHKRRKENNDT